MQILSSHQQVYKYIILNDSTNLRSYKDALFEFCITEFWKIICQLLETLTMFFVALKRFSINPNLMCSGGDEIVSLSTSG